MSPTSNEQETIDRVIEQQDAEALNRWQRVEPDQDHVELDDEVLAQWESDDGTLTIVVTRDERDDDTVYNVRVETLEDDVPFSKRHPVRWEESLESALDDAIIWMRNHRPGVPFPTFSMRIEGGIFKPLVDLLRRFGGGKTLIEVREEGILFESASHVTFADFLIPAGDMESYDVEQTGEATVDADAIWNALKPVNFSDVVPVSMDGSEPRPRLGVAAQNMAARVSADYLRRRPPAPTPFDARFTVPGLEFRDKMRAAGIIDSDSMVFGARDGAAFFIVEDPKVGEEVTGRFDTTELEGEQVVVVDPNFLQELRKAAPRPSQTPMTFTLRGDDPMLAEYTVGDTDVDVRIAHKTGAVPREVNLPPAEVVVPEDAQVPEEEPEPEVDFSAVEAAIEQSAPGVQAAVEEEDGMFTVTLTPDPNGIKYVDESPIERDGGSLGFAIKRALETWELAVDKRTLPWGQIEGMRRDAREGVDVTIPRFPITDEISTHQIGINAPIEGRGDKKWSILAEGLHPQETRQELRDELERRLGKDVIEALFDATPRGTGNVIGEATWVRDELTSVDLDMEHIGELLASAKRERENAAEAENVPESVNGWDLGASTDRLTGWAAPFDGGIAVFETFDQHSVRVRQGEEVDLGLAEIDGRPEWVNDVRIRGGLKRFRGPWENMLDLAVEWMETHDAPVTPEAANRSVDPTAFFDVPDESEGEEDADGVDAALEEAVEEMEESHDDESSAIPKDSPTDRRLSPDEWELLIDAINWATARASEADHATSALTLREISHELSGQSGAVRKLTPEEWATVVEAARFVAFEAEHGGDPLDAAQDLSDIASKLVGQAVHPDVDPLVVHEIKEGDEGDEPPTEGEVEEEPEEEEEAPTPPPEEEEPEEGEAEVVVRTIGGNPNYVVAGTHPGKVEDEAINAVLDTLGQPGQFDLGSIVASVEYRGDTITAFDFSAGEELIAEMDADEDDEPEEVEEVDLEDVVDDVPEGFGVTVEGTFADEVIEAGEVEEVIEEVDELSKSEVETIVEGATEAATAQARVVDGRLIDIVLNLEHASPVSFTVETGSVKTIMGDTRRESIQNAIDRWEAVTRIGSLTDGQVASINEARLALNEQFDLDIPLLEPSDIEGFSEGDIREIVEESTAGVSVSVKTNPDADSLRVQFDQDVGSDVAFAGTLQEVQGQVTNPAGAIRDALNEWAEDADLATVDLDAVNRARTRVERRFDLNLPRLEKEGGEAAAPKGRSALLDQWNSLMVDMELVELDEDVLIEQEGLALPVEVDQEFSQFADEEGKTQIEQGLLIHHTEDVHDEVHAIIARALDSEPEDFWDSSKPSELEGYDLFYRFTLTRNNAPGQWTNPRFAPSTLFKLLRPVDGDRIKIVSRGAPLA